MIKYRVTFNAGGYTETLDEDEAKALRAASSQGAVITAIHSTWGLENDPEVRVFESLDEAFAAQAALREDTFPIIVSHALIDPQPEGLND